MPAPARLLPRLARDVVYDTCTEMGRCRSQYRAGHPMAQPEVRRDFEVDFDSDVPEISERLKEVFDDGNVAKFSFTALLGPKIGNSRSIPVHAAC